MARRALQEVLDDPWVAERRAAGGQILVTGISGRIMHADEGVAALAGRTDVPTNAFDMIAPGSALEASAMVAKHLGRHIVSRFPWADTQGRRHWCRFEVRWPKGLIVMAVFPEDDPERQHIHAERVD